LIPILKESLPIIYTLKNRNQAKRLDRKEIKLDKFERKLKREVVESSHRSHRREMAVEHAYGIKCEVMVNDVRNVDGDWLTSEVVITLKNGREYKLLDVFNEDDNRTDFAQLTYINRDGELEEDVFESYADAEFAFVDVVKKGL
jgi:hypothetical protein